MTPEKIAEDLIAAHVGAGNVVADPWVLYAAMVAALKEAAGRGLHRMGPVTPTAAPKPAPENSDLSWPHQEASP